MAGNELDADNLHPDRLMATVKMIDWMRLNASVTHKDAEIARLKAALEESDKDFEAIRLTVCPEAKDRMTVLLTIRFMAEAAASRAAQDGAR